MNPSINPSGTAYDYVTAEDGTTLDYEMECRWLAKEVGMQLFTLIKFADGRRFYAYDGVTARNFVRDLANGREGEQGWGCEYLPGRSAPLVSR